MRKKTELDSLHRLLDAAAKYRKQGLFNPVVQRFEDPVVEARVKAAEDSTVAEELLKGSATGRGYDLVTHEVKDAASVKQLDEAERSRQFRFTLRSQMEQTHREREELAVTKAAMRPTPRIRMEIAPWDKIEMSRHMDAPPRTGSVSTGGQMQGAGSWTARERLSTETSRRSAGSREASVSKADAAAPPPPAIPASNVGSVYSRKS